MNKNIWSLRIFLSIALYGGTLGIPALAKAASLITPDANSVLLWHLNEPSGSTTFADASSHGFNGTGFDVGAGKIIPGVPGVLDNGVQMDGVTNRNFIRTLNTQSVYSGGSFTLQLWIKNPLLTTPEATLGRVIAQERTGATSNLIAWSLGLNADGSLKFFSNSTQSGTGISLSTSALTWDLDTWYNLSLVSDTTGAPENQANYSIYRAVDNAGTLTLIGSFTAGAIKIDTSGTFEIGGDQGYLTDAKRSYGGQMDEVQFSNVARSQAYLLASVPEPSTYALLGVGGWVIWAAFRRKEKADEVV